MFGVVVSQANASFSDTVSAFGNTISASVWGETAEPNWESVSLQFHVLNDQNEFNISQRVQNPDFEQDLESPEWLKKGEVFHIETYDVASLIPKNGLKMIRLGSDGESGTSITSNSLSQLLTSAEYSPQALSFWYQVVSDEWLQGFDNPLFTVNIGERQVYQAWRDDISYSSNTESFISDWNQVIVPFPEGFEENVLLTFSAGNYGDEQHPSFILLDNLSTEVALVNADSQVRITAESGSEIPNDLQIHYSYGIDGEEISGSSQPGESALNFRLEFQPDDYLIRYWFSNARGENFSLHEIPIYFQHDAPLAIHDLEVHVDKNQRYTFTFTSPESYFQDRVTRYEIRFAQIPITELDEWENISLLPVENMTRLPGSNIAPRKSFHKEKISAHFIEFPGQYYFAIKSFDMFGNDSEISNVFALNLE